MKPSVIGYWAKIHGLTFEECVRERALQGSLLEEGARGKFDEGYENAERELRQEKLDQLYESLRLANS